ncbi:MAG: hypothetical protein KDA22_07595, partial [Phycisphaerales bacterium]|nr:hypothetical protein [Phycisphaerales bacterium]
MRTRYVVRLVGAGLTLVVAGALSGQETGRSADQSGAARGAEAPPSIAPPATGDAVPGPRPGGRGPGGPGGPMGPREEQKVL